eukprot:755161-Hanusia_phi.AAC.8
MLPELDGKTAKMYRGGKICLTVSCFVLFLILQDMCHASYFTVTLLKVHFNPLWQRNVPKFGIAHAMALGMGPWLAAEVPDLVGAPLTRERKLKILLRCPGVSSNLLPTRSERPAEIFFSMCL